MGRIINSTYITLDGVIESPHRWPSLGRPGDERWEQIAADLLSFCDAVLMGRRTYDVFAPVWPTRSGDAYSDRINAMPKYVVSTTLQEPEWANTRVIAGGVAERLAELRASADVVQYGFGPVSRLLLEHGLLDELQLWVHPLILGRARPEHRLFTDGPAVGFDLAGTTPLSDGTVILRYRTDRVLGF